MGQVLPCGICVAKYNIAGLPFCTFSPFTSYPPTPLCPCCAQTHLPTPSFNLSGHRLKSSSKTRIEYTHWISGRLVNQLIHRLHQFSGPTLVEACYWISAAIIQVGFSRASCCSILHGDVMTDGQQNQKTANEAVCNWSWRVWRQLRRKKTALREKRWQQQQGQWKDTVAFSRYFPSWEKDKMAPPFHYTYKNWWNTPLSLASMVVVLATAKGSRLS